ncbi:branched-chain amino acid ABC transporter permease [Hydrogenibacillus schlegelii]|uniref:Branched-chain amino acid ABC transporter permease n=1 Tax=Hydrogenibacillus schlegelii TaxID=1484 RepID=A0A179ILD4_HYDSH|nr:branched-chain amino acid ABC transporter permease [Hydrogenibacillus schlegelii]MBT9282480.1 branched-chain amino acid ABC transporter permease [Hydrogenibacillus schlegelii]OAR03438.1 branched-chain amino acid ABC transporter permease [Hydrogenibacillus schlegelii]
MTATSFRARASQGATAGLLLALFLFPRVASNYWLDVFTSAFFYVILALGLNVVVGFAGLLDLGYAAFFAIGAYTTGILTTVYHVPFLLTVPAAAALAALSGVVIGAPALRLRSDYLAIVTLGFGEIIRITAKNLTLTGSASGIYGIPRPTVFGHALKTQQDFYYLLLILAIVTYLAMRRLEHSRVGRAWKYIREDEDAAAAMGIDPFRYKLLAFVVGAVVGGLAGTVFAVRMTAIAPESFGFMQSVLILLAVILGGLGRLPGVVLGAFLIVLLPEAMREFASWRYFLFGALLIAMMHFRPEGLWPAGRRKMPQSGRAALNGGDGR